MKRDLQELSLVIFQFCSKHSISIEIEWICRGANTNADMISNFIDIDDWGLSLSCCTCFKMFASRCMGQIRHRLVCIFLIMLSYLSTSLGSGMKALQGWTPSQKTGDKYLAYSYHLLFWCPEF